MMSIFWGQKLAGENWQKSKNKDTGEVALVYAPIPDWVRIPKETPHKDAGKAFRVNKYFKRGCICNVKHDSNFLTLKGSEILIVECEYRGWMCLSSYPKEWIMAGYENEKEITITNDPNIFE
jgi:hypothetical protein